LRTNVIVWHTDLNSNPAENASVVLAYHIRVCWRGLGINGYAGEI
jgi:hypothetical protein